ncbi:MAG: D-glycerate dehydrogenase [Defluviicoccus sp.]|nr:D-glycerate dehydrogenase [Defluviicoccus sp.]
MTNPKPAVLVTRKLPQAIETRLMELFETRLNPTDEPMSAEALIAASAETDVLVPTVTDRLAAEVIDALPERLRLIANFGVGVDHIDLAAAAARGILVTNTPGVLTEDTADLTMALMLSAPRRMVEGDRLARSGEWDGWTPTFMMGERVSGKRLGIVGMGRIGTAVARRARGFSMSIHYHNRRRVHRDVEAELEATWWEDLDQMLAHMDFISINCPHTSETRHLLSEARLRSLQPHAFVVNTSRGEIIDEAALARCLAEGVLGGAGLDVYEREPEIEAGLRRLDNVVLAPHLGSATREGRIAMGERVLINIRTHADGYTPPDRVIPADGL